MLLLDVQETRDKCMINKVINFKIKNLSMMFFTIFIITIYVPLFNELLSIVNLSAFIYIDLSLEWFTLIF